MGASPRRLDAFRRRARGEDILLANGLPVNVLLLSLSRRFEGHPCGATILPTASLSRQPLCNGTAPHRIRSFMDRIFCFLPKQIVCCVPD